MALCSALVFAVLPVFAVYGLETSAEPALNWCICTVLWFFLRYVTSVNSEEPMSGGILYWGAYTSALLFSQCVKREGVLLTLVLPLTLPLVLRGPRPRARLWLKTALPIVASSAIALFFSVHMRLAETAVNEASLAKQFPLTIGRLAMFAAGFLRSFSVGQWYAGSCFAAALGIFIACRRRDLTIVPVAVLLAYIVLYALHIRGYYEMQSERIDPSEALRFSMSFMSLWALAAGMGICGFVRWERAHQFYRVNRRLLRPILWVALPSLIAVCFGLTLRLRDYGDEDERNVRIKPALAALDLARGNAYIASLEPLVIQMYGAPTDKVVDLETVLPSDLDLVSSHEGPCGFLLIEQALHDSEPDEIRYGPQMRFLKSLSRRKLYEGADFRVVELGGHMREAGATEEVVSKRKFY